MAPEPTLARLPSVTPVRPTREASRAPLEASPTARPAVVPSPRLPPSATPGVVETEDGPVTPSMARLRLAAEPYATLGDPGAPITVVEFADFGCEFCRQFHLRTFGALRAEYIDTGKVYYVFKDLPVTSRQGALAAQAAECGGAQGRYWELHDALFAEPGAWYGGEAEALGRIRSAAEEVGLDAPALEACIVGGEQLPNVDRNFEEAQTLRLYGTPAFLINAKLLAGAQPIAVWREVLDGELAALDGR
jgi:protein-disulfide isomerase